MIIQIYLGFYAVDDVCLYQLIDSIVQTETRLVYLQRKDTTKRIFYTANI